MVIETSIAAVRAAEQRHGLISNNISNSGTIGYKAENSYFSSLVAGTSRFGSFTPGGVRATILSDANEQGLLQSTGRTLDLGVAGRGMLVYAKGDGNNKEYGYSRAGQIVIDKDGNLINASNNWKLQGYETDIKGNPKTNATGNIKSLSTINLTQAKALSKPQKTTKIDGTINLPSSIRSTDNIKTKESVITAYDSLGEIHELTVTWEKTVDSPATWTASVAVQGGGGTVTRQDNAGAYTDIEIVFDGNGNPVTFNGGATMPNISIDWSNSANNSNIIFDLGSQNESNGITSVAGTFDDGLKSDGKEIGKFSDLAIDDDGNVIALFTNGESAQFAKIPLIDFPASHTLSLISGNIYLQSELSGQYSLSAAGNNGMGNINSGALEQSTVDLAENLTLMMKNQRFQSSNVSVIKGDEELFKSIQQLFR